MPSTIAVTCSESSLLISAEKIAKELQLPFVRSMDDVFDVYLVLTPERLQLQASGDDAPGAVYVDFIGGALGHRLRFGGGRRQLIGRAVGLRKKEVIRVLDVTAGLGRDAYVLANLGCDVTMVESSSVVTALLEDGLKRAAESEHFSTLKLRLISGDALFYMQGLSESECPDVVYLDPMFPPLKKTAAVKKEMRILKLVVGEDEDSAALLEQARKIAQKRVVVKRHRQSPSIGNIKPDLVFEGKSSRFDVYLKI